MRILLPLMLVILLTAGGGGLYFLQKSLASGDLEITPMSETAMGSALTMVVENATGQTTIATEGDLRGFIPAAPEGWTVRPYEIADGTAITGHEVQRTMISKSSTNDLLQAFARDVGARKGAEVATFENGDRKIALRMRLLDRFNERTIQGGMMAAISANLTSMDHDVFGSSTLKPGLFAKLDGIEFEKDAGFSRVIATGNSVPVDYRTFTGFVGKMVEIQLITNAADADVAAVLSQINMAALNEMLPEYAPEYRAGVGWQVASTEPLATTPPPPSIASRAYFIVNDGRIYPPEETRLLQKMAEGRITSWAGVTDHTIVSDNLITLLGPEPQTREIKRAALILLEDESIDVSMRRLLREISSGNIESQAELFSRRTFRDIQVTPEFRAIMGMLPVGEVNNTMLNNTQEQQAQQPEPVADKGPVIRRGVAVQSGNAMDNCTIELGVRRCILTDDG